MGAKQSKRSVDISGKEAEGAASAGSEVAAAGGEGRVEALADADTLKPQLNGDAHIQPPQDDTDKEKQLENGTPENEKDATTEKEVVVTNGSGGEEPEKPERENGDAKPSPDAENNKKNKKDKLKKKWSLRSISFSRKEKPKQEKKHKEEESKANGEPEKLPEEVTEATPEVIESKSSDDLKNVVVEESKDEKTPDTPVTEPITNGSSTPESPKEEVLVKEESSVSSPLIEEPKDNANPIPEPENLPVNGLSLEDVKDLPEVPKVVPEESKADETAVPAPETPASIPENPKENEESTTLEEKTIEVTNIAEVKLNSEIMAAVAEVAEGVAAAAVEGGAAQ